LEKFIEMRDRSFENQRYWASGLKLVVAAIILWNTVYLERAIRCCEGPSFSGTACGFIASLADNSLST
jgi:Tn3 transposase DDE domain